MQKCDFMLIYFNFMFSSISLHVCLSLSLFFYNSIFSAGLTVKDLRGKRVCSALSSACNVVVVSEVLNVQAKRFPVLTMSWRWCAVTMTKRRMEMAALVSVMFLGGELVVLSLNLCSYVIMYSIYICQGMCCFQAQNRIRWGEFVNTLRGCVVFRHGRGLNGENCKVLKGLCCFQACKRVKWREL